MLKQFSCTEPAPRMAVNRTLDAAFSSAPPFQLLMINGKARTEANLVRWQSSACRAFYQKPASSMSLMTTLEDRCESGRRETKPFHVAQEVILVRELKLAYVTVRKAASTTIGSILNLLAKQTGGFHSSASKFICQDGHKASGRQCTAETEMNTWWHSLCNTLCLDKRTLSTYYFFSFVRSPLSRFYSSFAQMLTRDQNYTQMWAAQTVHTRTQLMIDYVDRLSSGRCKHDLHLETQSMSLATPTIAFGKIPYSTQQLHVDFIGRVEHLSEDFEQMLMQAESKTGANTSRKLWPKVRDLLEVTAHDAAVGRQHAATKKFEEGVLQARSVELDRRISEVYAQDIACFGK